MLLQIYLKIKFKKYYDFVGNFKIQWNKNVDGIVGVVFRYQDEFNFYSAEFYDERAYIKIMKDGFIKEISVVSNIEIEHNQLYGIQVVAQKNHLVLKMQKTTEDEDDYDDFPIILDCYNEEISIGSIGYYSDGKDIDVCFGDMQVKALPCLVQINFVRKTYEYTAFAGDPFLSNISNKSNSDQKKVVFTWNSNSTRTELCESEKKPAPEIVQYSLPEPEIKLSETICETKIVNLQQTQIAYCERKFKDNNVNKCKKDFCQSCCKKEIDFFHKQRIFECSKKCSQIVSEDHLNFDENFDENFEKLDKESDGPYYDENKGPDYENEECSLRKFPKSDIHNYCNHHTGLESLKINQFGKSYCKTNFCQLQCIINSQITGIHKSDNQIKKCYECCCQTYAEYDECIPQKETKTCFKQENCEWEGI